MTPHPLQLRTLAAQSIRIEAKDGPFAANTNVVVNHTFRRGDPDISFWIVDLAVSFQSVEELPLQYEGEIKVRGYFQIADSALEEEKKLKTVAVSCPSILYGAARELVANFTSRGVNGTFLLPSVSFSDQNLIPPEQRESPQTVEANSSKR